MSCVLCPTNSARWMYDHSLIYEYFASFALGISISIGIVLFTPSRSLFTFDEEEYQNMDSLMRTEVPDGKLEDNQNIDISSESVNPYIDNPQLPTRLHYRRKKSTHTEVTESTITSDVATALGKNPKLKKFFGVSDDALTNVLGKDKLNQPLPSVLQVNSNISEKKPKLSPEARTTVNDAKDEILRLLDTQEQLTSVESGLFSAVMFFITIFGILAALLLMNIATNGDFGRIIVGMFPRETEALKIKDFLIRFHN